MSAARKKPAKKKPRPAGPRTVDELKAAPSNPRTITPEALRALGASLQDFGDLSGIVWNKRTGYIVAGHQRKAALEREHGTALKVRGNSLVTPAGERFPIRVVDWPPEKAETARVVANSPHLAGDWTEDVNETLAKLERTLGPQFLELRLDELQAETEQAVSRVRQLDLMQRPISMVWLLVGVPADQAAAVLPHFDEIGKLDGVLCQSTIR